MSTATPSGLLRLVYVSRSSLPATDQPSGIHPELARILMQSRRNNPRQGLVGALYFGDGHFFQVLEGAATEVEALYRRLGSDPRHRDLKVLSRQPIAQLSFAGWAMKHVPNAAEVQSLLARHGLKQFEPAAFDPATLEAMVNLLIHGPDQPLPTSGARSLTLNQVATQTRWALGIATAALATALLSVFLPLLR